MKNLALLALLFLVISSCESIQTNIEKNDAKKEFHKYDINNMIKLAELCMKKGDYQKAKKTIMELLNKNPDNFEANYKLGIIYYKLGNFNNSIQCFYKTLLHNKNHAKAYYNLAAIYSSNEDDNFDIDKASIFFKKFLALEPKSIHKKQICNWLSIYQSNKSLTNSDIKTINDLIAFNNNQFVEDKNNIIKKHSFKLNHKKLANKYYRRGQLNKAKNHFILSLKEKNKDKEIFYKLGVIHYQKGLLKKSCSYFNQSNNLDKKNYYSKSFYYLGKIYSREGSLYNPKKASYCFSKYLSLVPSTCYKKEVSKWLESRKIENNKITDNKPPKKNENNSNNIKQLNLISDNQSYKDWLQEQANIFVKKKRNE